MSDTEINLGLVETLVAATEYGQHILRQGGEIIADRGINPAWGGTFSVEGENLAIRLNPHMAPHLDPEERHVMWAGFVLHEGAHLCQHKAGLRPLQKDMLLGSLHPEDYVLFVKCMEADATTQEILGLLELEAQGHSEAGQVLQHNIHHREILARAREVCADAPEDPSRFREALFTAFFTTPIGARYEQDVMRYYEAAIPDELKDEVEPCIVPMPTRLRDDPDARSRMLAQMKQWFPALPDVGDKLLDAPYTTLKMPAKLFHFAHGKMVAARKMAGRMAIADIRGPGPV